MFELGHSILKGNGVMSVAREVVETVRQLCWDLSAHNASDVARFNQNYSGIMSNFYIRLSTKCFKDTGTVSALGWDSI